VSAPPPNNALQVLETGFLQKISGKCNHVSLHYKSTYKEYGVILLQDNFHCKNLFTYVSYCNFFIFEKCQQTASNVIILHCQTLCCSLHITRDKEILINNNALFF